MLVKVWARSGWCLPSPFFEQSWWHEGIFGIAIYLPETEGHKRKHSYDHGCNNMCIVPWVLSPAIVDSKEEQDTACGKEEKSNIIQLSKKLHFSLSIILVFGLECWWIVDKEEQDQRRSVEASHVNISSSPAYGSPTNEGESDKWPKKAYAGHEIE